jgi:hypothetical protein
MGATETIGYVLNMTRTVWMAIAEVLGGLRAGVVGTWPPRDDFASEAPEGLARAQMIHQRKVAYLSQLELLDKLATLLAATLDRLCSNFDRHHFLRIVSGRSPQA